MVEHLHIQILPLNLLHGFLLNLRCMLFRITKDLSQMKILSYH